MVQNKNKALVVDTCSNNLHLQVYYNTQQISNLVVGQVGMRLNSILHYKHRLRASA